MIGNPGKMNSIDEIMYPEMVRVWHDISADDSKRAPLVGATKWRQEVSDRLHSNAAMYLVSGVSGAKTADMAALVPVLISKTYIVAMPALILARVSGDPVT